MKYIKLYIYLIFFSLISLTACKNKKHIDDFVITPLPELYQNGINLLEKAKYAKAAEEFNKIFFQHPGNNLTPQAELMQGYALYMAREYDEAVDVMDTFISLHPMHQDIAYAYYLKALSYYMQIAGVELDQSRTALAKSSFEDVIARFPDTKYAIDATLKIDLVNEHLAGKEMEIGRFLFKKENPIAASRRFQDVVDNYQTTSHIPEALYRLTVCYMQLGLLEEAKKYAAVLGNNYQGSSWYEYSYDLVMKSTSSR